MYYARVGGNFTWEEKELQAYIECISHKDGIYKVSKEIFPEKAKIEEKVEEGAEKGHRG